MRERPRYRLLVAALLAPPLLAGCTGGGPGSLAGSDEPEPLSEFEEEVVAKWYRYHRYDDSRQYLILRADRTGCEWEEPSSGGRTKTEAFAIWYLDEASAEDATLFQLMVKNAPSDEGYAWGAYDYAEDAVYVGGYENLAMVKTTTDKDCP